MADASLHIADCYYFEVPRFLYRYTSLSQVPDWLKNPEWVRTATHPDDVAYRHLLETATLEDWQHELDGKILIPQPFGAPRSLYESGTGWCISKFMVLELVACLLIVAVFTFLARRVAASPRPQGKFVNLFETLLVFVRDNIARPAIGEHHADHFLPVLWTLFFFILFCNLIGLIPWTGTATGNFGTTLALALVTFLTVLISGKKELGLWGFWGNMIPHIELPGILRFVGYPIQAFIFLIEVLGLCIRHGVLAIRLLANMVAGHLVILAILGMIIAAAETGTTFTWTLTAVIGVLGTLAFNLLELFVAFLQAYVFTFLSALFIGMAIHHH